MQLDVTLNLPGQSETPEKENRPPRQSEGFQGTGRFPKDHRPPGPRKKVGPERRILLELLMEKLVPIRSH